MRQLALSKEAVLRERLLEVVSPRRQIRVGVRLNIRVDVVRSGEVLRVATNVKSIRVLVHADVIDAHRRGERQVVQVDLSEVGRHAEVGNEIHRFLGDRTIADFDTLVGGQPRLLDGPGYLVVRDPGDVLVTQSQTNLAKRKTLQTYRVIETWLVLEPINGELLTTELIRIRI